MNDWELLEQFRSGRSAQTSQQAFAELVRRHAGFVYATCRRRLRNGEAHLAEDVAQAVFLVLARRPPRCSGSSALAGWLHQTAVYACNNAMRAEQIRRHHEHEAAARHTAAVTSARAPEFELVLERAMDELSSGDRGALLLRYYEGRDVAEVGMALGISQNTAAKRISRAIDRLRHAMLATGEQAAPVAIADALLRMTREPPPPPHLSSSIVNSALTNGSSVSSSISEQIAEGVNHMIRQLQLKWMATVTVAAAFGVGAVITAGTLLAQANSTSGKAAAPPASQPAASAAPAAAAAATPKQVLHEFAAAVRAGDADKVAALAKAENEQERQLVQAASAYVASSGAFQKAVKEKLGADAAREMSSLFELTPVGRFTLFIETMVDKSPEAIEGNVAMIQPPEVEDLTFWLVKDSDGRWLMSVGRMCERWTADEWRDRIGLMHMAADALGGYTDKVIDGKYANVAELKRDLAPILRQNR